MENIEFSASNGVCRLHLFVATVSINAQTCYAYLCCPCPRHAPAVEQVKKGMERGEESTRLL